MGNGAYFDEKLRQITPTPSEVAQVGAAIADVDRTFNNNSEGLRIAERYPAGSFEKSTMLAGRKEADYVIVMNVAPDEHTFAATARMLRGDSGAESVVIKHKAIELIYTNGVKVDVLPVASQERSEGYAYANSRFTDGIHGREQVKWFKENAAGTVIPSVVRLTKEIRNQNPGLNPISSFTLELLAVDTLKGENTGLEASTMKVMERLAREPEILRRLCDPAESSNRPMSRLSDYEIQGIGSTAGKLVEAAKNGQPSALFTGFTTAPRPSKNLGGRTLG